MNKANRLSLLAMLVALTLALGWLESLIPVFLAIPGVKLGLSNIVLLFSLYTLRGRETLLLLFAKVLLSGLLFTGLPAFAYALTGGVCALGGMLVLKGRHLSIIGVSIGGAVCHNIGQIAAAVMILGTKQIVYLLAVLLIAGVITGAVTGLAAFLIIRALKKGGMI